jgi:hypothetical protein
MTIKQIQIDLEPILGTMLETLDGTLWVVTQIHQEAQFIECQQVAAPHVRVAVEIRSDKTLGEVYKIQ